MDCENQGHPIAQTIAKLANAITLTISWQQKNIDPIFFLVDIDSIVETEFIESLKWKGLLLNTDDLDTEIHSKSLNDALIFWITESLIENRYRH